MSQTEPNTAVITVNVPKDAIEMCALVQLRMDGNVPYSPATAGIETGSAKECTDQELYESLSEISEVLVAEYYDELAYRCSLIQGLIYQYGHRIATLEHELAAAKAYTQKEGATTNEAD